MVGKLIHLAQGERCLLLLFLCRLMVSLVESHFVVVTKEDEAGMFSFDDNL